jgi:hypothetical protein
LFSLQTLPEDLETSQSSDGPSTLLQWTAQKEHTICQQYLTSDLTNKIARWLINQHWRQWWSLGYTKRQARELILGPCLGTKARLLSFNRMKYMIVTGLLTGHNTLRRHLHLKGLRHSSLCRKCGAEDETSAHIFVSVKPWLRSGMCIWAAFIWSQRIFRM